jgi:hypothetical protein
VATYYRDFADGIADFTEIVLTSGHTTPAWSVVNTNELQATSTANEQEMLAWDDINSDADSDDVEVLGQFKFPTTSTSHRIFVVRVAGADANNKTTYYVRMSTTAFVVGRSTGSTATTIISNSATYSVDTWYWVRFRVNGSALQARIWTGAVGDEPTSSWTIDTTDSTYTDAGRVGPAKGLNTITTLWRYFGVGTNGDTAPSSAPTTGITASARNLLLLAAG